MSKLTVTQEFAFPIWDFETINRYFNSQGGIQIYRDVQFGHLIYEARIVFGQINTEELQTLPQRYTYLGWTDDPESIIFITPPSHIGAVSGYTTYGTVIDAYRDARK